MKSVRAWLHAVCSACSRRRNPSASSSAELESHLQLHVDDNLRAGMTPARRGGAR